MADDLSDVYAEIRALKEKVRVLETTNPLEASSIRDGRMRFIGGTLRVDSGGRVEIVGSLQIDGTTTVDGSTIVNGTFKIEGPWSLNGNGEIAGNVTVTGKLTQNGSWEFIGAGQITGNVSITGTLSVTGGGRVNVGSAMSLTPATDGGALVFSDGSKLSNNASSIGLTKGSNSVRVGDATAGLLAGSNSVTVSAQGVQINLAAIPTQSGTGLPANTLLITAQGFLRRSI